MLKKKNTWGGSRTGAGRKKEEETMRIRVPVRLHEAILELLKKNPSC